MSLQNQINEDLKKAQKEKDKDVISTLRLLRSALKYEAINQKKELSEEDVVKIIRSEVKKRKEAMEEYNKGGREDLAAKEEKELSILQKYLPKELSEEEIGKIVDGIITNMEEVTMKDFGKVMGGAMKEVSGKASGDVVSKVVKEKLS